MIILIFVWVLTLQHHKGSKAELCSYNMIILRAVTMIVFTCHQGQFHYIVRIENTDRTDYVFFFNNKKYTEIHTFGEEYRECGISIDCSKALSLNSRRQNNMIIFPVIKSPR
jgi:hypothetical protein